MNENTKHENERDTGNTEHEETTHTYEITIDGDTYEVSNVSAHGHLPVIHCEGLEFYVAQDSEAAGEAVKVYYRDMIEDTPNEFVSLVGSDTLISWGMGRWAGAARDLEGWLGQVAGEPEMCWGIHDFTEYEIDQVSQGIVDELGFVPSVAYRCD